MKSGHCVIFMSICFLAACSSSGNIVKEVDPYEISIPDNGNPVTLPPNYFSDTTNGQAASQYPTTVILSYDKNKQALSVQFRNAKDLYVGDNQYKENNSAMWNQEVFEMFISSGTTTPKNYIEIEVNPNNALFSARISNPDGTGTKNLISYFDGESAGIELNTMKNPTKNAWLGSFSFPLSLAGNITSSYRINFYRVIATKMPNTSTTWACSPGNCAYLAWSPTYSGETPAFHVPQYFGVLKIVAAK